MSHTARVLVMTARNSCTLVRSVRRSASCSFNAFVRIARASASLPRRTSMVAVFFFSSRRRHTRSLRDWVQTCALPIFPHFIDHYKRMGVKTLHIIDNGSTDDTAKICAAESCVTLWHTRRSYAEAAIGQLWVGAIARK